MDLSPSSCQAPAVRACAKLAVWPGRRGKAFSQALLCIESAARVACKHRCLRQAASYTESEAVMHAVMLMVLPKGLTQSHGQRSSECRRTNHCAALRRTLQLRNLSRYAQRSPHSALRLRVRCSVG